MVDIAKCQGTKEDKICPKRNECYRYRVKSDGFQTYFSTPPFTDEGCSHFMSIEGWDKRTMNKVKE